MASYQRMTCAVFFLSSFAVLNVFLYASLLPLWEGFDEPFHFGYVQYVANQWKFPDVRTTHLSEEVAESLLLTPASIYVQRNVPAVQTYSDYFSMSVEQRRHQRTQLYQVPTIARGKESKFLNYEAHHAPMAYALLAGPEQALAFMPLVQRVLVLRIVAGLTGALFLYWGMHQLFVNLALPSTFRLAAIFCIFCSQMTWATIAHVTNDWLAFPLTTWTLVMLIRYRRNPTLSVGVQLAAVLTGGLLTKSYFRR